MEKNVKVESELLDLQGNMRNFAYSLTLDKDAAEDLLQDTTLRVLDNQEKFAENVNFKGWVLTIMKNIFINNYRRIVRNQTVIDKTDDLHLLDPTLYLRFKTSPAQTGTYLFTVTLTCAERTISQTFPLTF